MRTGTLAESELVKAVSAGTAGAITRHGNNQLVSYGYVGLHSNITNQIIIASADYVT